MGSITLSSKTIWFIIINPLNPSGLRLEFTAYADPECKISIHSTQKGWDRIINQLTSNFLNKRQRLEII